MDLFTTKEVYNRENLKILFLKIKTLEKKYKVIKNWRFNREADESRVKMIKQSMIKEKTELIPGIVCAWEIDNYLEIYDGFHRYSACKDLENCRILIKIISTKDVEIIRKDFENVNKSLYVPAMYIEKDRNENKIKVCDQVYELLKKRFPENVSFSNSPQQQNFNKNSIIYIVSNLKVDYSKPTIYYEIYDCLIKINETIKSLGLRPRYYKTTKTGFWLFFWTFDKIIEDINTHFC